MCIRDRNNRNNNQNKSYTSADNLLKTYPRLAFSEAKVQHEDVDFNDHTQRYKFFEKFDVAGRKAFIPKGELNVEKKADTGSWKSVAAEDVIARITSTCAYYFLDITFEEVEHTTEVFNTGSYVTWHGSSKIKLTVSAVNNKSCEPVVTYEPVVTFITGYGENKSRSHALRGARSVAKKDALLLYFAAACDDKNVDKEEDIPETHTKMELIKSESIKQTTKMIKQENINTEPNPEPVIENRTDTQSEESKEMEKTISDRDREESLEKQLHSITTQSGLNLVFDTLTKEEKLRYRPLFSKRKEEIVAFNE